MAEAVGFSLASKVLSTIASSAFAAAYKEGLSIWDAKDELSKLQVSIQTIRGVLLDAEKRQQDYAIKDWIKRVKGVLYDANDLFDKVATQSLLKQQIQGGNHNPISKKVMVSCSKLNPIISRYTIAKEVKAIRMSLAEISRDMAQYKFIICPNEVQTFVIRMGQDLGSFVDAKLVIGREDDKKTVLDMLYGDSNIDVQVPVVIAIVGIGGMGKSTLAQLIYNDEEVRKTFDHLFFARISDTTSERKVMGRIFQSIHGKDNSNFSVGQLQTKIRDSIKGQRILLVLDDVWEDHRGRWELRLGLFNSCAKGSRIIVTTRFLSVAHAVNASGVHNLEGLSEKDAWCLFKRLALSPNHENDSRWESLGTEILKRCWGVPLAIQSVGSLLSERNTISEWKEIERQGFLENIGNKETMSVLKFSYDHLSSNMKHCFAYCSLFPKDYRFMKHELICLWSAQGYIEPDNEESSFMHLLRRGFFQEVEKDERGEVLSCKMHDIMHDLALYVAGEETIAISDTTSHNLSSFTSNISVKDWNFDVEQLKFKRLHSVILMSTYSGYRLATLDKLCKKFNMLRTLNLRGQGFKEMLPTSIGELTHMRYLDLSFNLFEKLPDCITNLVNLFSLNLMGCYLLKALPSKFQNLVELRYLNIEECGHLETNLTGIVELSHLQYLYLGEFIVRQGSELGELARLQQQFRGDLLISDMEDEYESNWKLPICVQKLVIKRYSGVRLLDWGTIDGTNNYLAHLRLDYCPGVKHLPPLQCLHNLRSLELEGLMELEFLESEEDYSTSPYLPRLEKLTLNHLSNLKRWSKTTPSALAFPLLSDVHIFMSPLLELASFPQCPRLRQLFVSEVDINNDDVIQRPPLPSTLFCPSVSPPPLEDVSISGCNWLPSLPVEATMSLRRLWIDCCSSLKLLQVGSPYLQQVYISNCEGLVSLEAAAATPSLTALTIRACNELKNLNFGAPLSALERLAITDCPNLDFLEWDSLVNLRTLGLSPMPPTENIPLSLRNRQSLGALKISHW